MRQLPSGTLTMLFTDMEGSTRLLQRLGNRYAELLKKCRGLLRLTFQQYNGYEVDTQGDAFFVVFESALDAISAAIISQRTLFATQWPENVPVRIRIGIHTGEPQPVEEGYIGLDVHRAARIMSVAHGGQVLISQITRDLVLNDLPDEILLRDLGEHRLKDIAGQTRLFQVLLPDLPAQDSARALAEAQSVSRLLPSPSTSFVGRKQELESLAQLIYRPEIRLLTLMGPAGVGKTRLALRVAEEVAGHFAGNLAFVALEQINEVNDVLPAIAQTLSIQEESAVPLKKQIAALLKGRPFLLILDNFEQVIPAGLAVAQLLTDCPQLKILVTSRVLLHLQAEHLFEVSPLPLPDPQAAQDLPTVSQSAAIALFVQRAQAVAPTFRLNSENAQQVREVCERLDGLPLAIELAAAQLRHIPVSTMLARLQENAVTLEGPMQDLSERQRTLRGAIAWSYQLLTPVEQRVFRRLAVFANGATLEAIGNVCVEDKEAREDVGEILRSLVDKSMVQRQDRGEQEARFWLLATLSEYGKEQMVALEEWQKIRERHIDYYLSWLEQLAPLFSGAQRVYWMDQLNLAYENVRVALAGTLQQSQKDDKRAAQALRFCIALLGYWEVRGYLREGLGLMEQALSSARPVALSLRAQTFYGAGLLALILDDNQRAEHFLRQCQLLFRETGDRVGMLNILRLQGNLALARNNYKIARRLFEEALTIYQERGETQKVIATREALAQVAMAQGDYTRARTFLTENLTRYRESGEVYAIAYPLYFLARNYFLSQEDLSEAKALAEESLASFNAVGNRRFSAHVLGLLGQIALFSGETDEEEKARALLQESLDVFSAMEERSGQVEALLALARLEAKRESYQASQSYYNEAWRLLQAIGAKELIARCLEGAALLAVAQQRLEQSATLWGTAATVRAAIVAPLPPVYRPLYLTVLTQVRQDLGEERFQELWSQGHQTPWENIRLAHMLACS